MAAFLSDKVSAALRRIWHSEDSAIGRRLKQVIAWVVPKQLLVAAKKRYYLALLMNSKTPRESDMSALNRFVGAGDFVLDIGAFVGFYAQQLSKLVGASGVVWSFEPVPETRAVLTHIVKAIPLGNVRVFAYALSDSDDNAVMEIPRYRHGGESLYDARIITGAAEVNGSLRRVDIQRRTLDSIFRDSEASSRPVRFMKLDVEFHELQAVTGALALIRRDHPVLLIELLNAPAQRQAQLELLRVLSNEGYAAFRFSNGRFAEFRIGEASQNVFFLTDFHRAHLDTGDVQRPTVHH